MSKINVDSESKLGRIVHEALDLDPTSLQESIEINIMDGHFIAIANDEDNIQKLYNAGFKIVSRADDGIIEAMEDVHGNLYFEYHPEVFLFTRDKRENINEDFINGKKISTAIFHEFFNRKLKD